MRFHARAALTSILAACLASPVAVASAGDIQATLEAAARWLASQQNPDKGFGPYGDQRNVRLKNTSDVGITSFAVYALSRCPQALKAKYATQITDGVGFLLSKQQSDGGFYDLGDPSLQNYKTCVTLLALTSLDRAKYADAIKKAQKFIMAQQFDEDDGYKPNDNLGYGGFGYGDKGKPRGDLSNTQFSLEALAESGISGSEDLWKRAVVYIARCQNSKTVDPLLKDLKIGTTGDGGFRYSPGETRGPDTKNDAGPRLISSYGSMTYAALKSMLYANVTKKDPMVQEAFAWISSRFTVRENPGMATKERPDAGLQGLFYYYHTMAKCLLLYGEATITDEKGIRHDWARELSDHLISLEQADGSWKNSSERWHEEIPALATAFAIVVLVDCQAAIQRSATPAGANAASQ